MSFFTRERFEHLEAEQEAFEQACLEAARAFERLTRPDIESGDGGHWQKIGRSAPWAKYASNRSYAYEYGSSYADSSHVHFSEDRFGDRFELPLEFVYDPDGFTARYKQESDSYHQAVAAQRADDERAAVQRREQRDRDEYARLKAKFDGEDA